MEDLERNSRHNWNIEEPQGSGDPTPAWEPWARIAAQEGHHLRHNLKPGRAHRLRIQRPVRTRKNNIVWLNLNTLVPEWWPCLCNGGWDPCPVCRCGLEQEPPCGPVRRFPHRSLRARL